MAYRSTPKTLSAARAKAWETRRAKYGKNGMSGPYACGNKCGACESMRAMIVRLHVEEVLSEGQAAKAMKCGRIELRKKADDYNNREPQVTHD